MVMKACNENSPQMGATMVKFQNGMLAAYGGTYCIQAPVDMDLECAFNPHTMVKFYRKDRTGASYTIKDGKMIARHKRETLRVKCLEPSEVPIIDVLSEKRKTIGLPKKALNYLMRCVDNAHCNHALQGILLRDSELTATDARVGLVVKCDIRGIDVVIPSDTIGFIVSKKEDITHYAYDQNHLKFWFSDGVTLCTRLIDSSDYPNLDKIFNSRNKSFKINKDLLEELKSVDCNTITVSKEGASYSNENDDKGFFAIESEDEFNFSANKKYFDIINDLNLDNTFGSNDRGHLIFGNGGNYFKSVLSTLTIQ